MFDISNTSDLTTLSPAQASAPSTTNASTRRIPPRRRFDDVLKAIMDYGFTSIGLLILSPVLLILALIVKLDSPGPVLYRRRVMGQGGTQFDAFKFRTMRVDGDEILVARPELRVQLEQNHKLTDDPRITRSGRWLRRLSLDELPQLLNVMRGQMSLIGPRMISPPEVARYGEYAEELFTVKPGISGLWQVSGRSNLTPSDRVRLDIQYVRTRSAWTDFELLVQTIPAVLKGRGAY
jgi:lipopolysaccharide/colanic/teichoic acid biosynthesis glycosyltransferase